MAAVIAKLASLPITIQERLCSITDGLPARCRYFPSVYEIGQIVAAWESIKPTPPQGYKYFDREPPIKKPPEAVRREQVERMVGDLKAYSASLHDVVPKSDPNAAWRKPGPPRRETVKLIAEQGRGYILSPGIREQYRDDPEIGPLLEAEG